MRRMKAKSPPCNGHGHHPRSRGQSLIETGIVIVLFVTVALGAITFGHAFMVVNMITHAARDGARIAATWPNRGTCGVLTNTGPIVTTVQNKIASVTTGTFPVNVTQNPTPAGAAPCGTPTTPTVRVQVTGCVPWVIPLLPVNVGTDCGGSPGFSVARTVDFYDEGLGG